MLVAGRNDRPVEILIGQTREKLDDVIDVATGGAVRSTGSRGGPPAPVHRRTEAQILEAKFHR